MIHDDMPFDPIQGQGHGGLKYAKRPISKPGNKAVYKISLVICLYEFT